MFNDVWMIQALQKFNLLLDSFPESVRLHAIFRELFQGTNVSPAGCFEDLREFALTRNTVDDITDANNVSLGIRAKYISLLVKAQPRALRISLLNLKHRLRHANRVQRRCRHFVAVRVQAHKRNRKQSVILG